MIKIDNVDVFGWESAIRGMRNPMNSWDKSDSRMEEVYGIGYVYKIGNNDLKLMKSLSKAGSDHGKFLRMINVTLDINAPLYWWKEFKTYRAGRKFADEEPDLIPDDYLEYDIEMNSCSTMHKIHSKPFTMDDFSCEHLLYDNFDYDIGGNDKTTWVIVNARVCLDETITTLNYFREKYLETKNKSYWWQMIQLLPSSYNQKRTVQLNYQVLKSMYFARKSHKLDEWVDFCKWIETLPYFKEVCLDE